MVAKTTTKSTTTNTTTKAAATKTATPSTSSSKINLINKEKAIEAINAVIKYAEIKKNTQPLNILADDNEDIFVSIETDKYYHDVQFKPYHITVPNPLFDLSSRRSLIIIQGNKEEAMDLKTKITELGYTGLFEVTSMKQFKKDYVTPELKVKLTKQYEELIVDSRFKQKIQHIFGKEIYLSSKSPKKVEVDLKNPVKIIETLNKLNRLVLIRSFSKLLFTLPIGNFEIGVDKIIENLSVILDEVYSKLPEKIKSIQSLSIKASDIRLPFYVSVDVPKELIFDSKKQQVVLPKEILEKIAKEQEMLIMDSDDDEDFEDFEDDDEEEEIEEEKVSINNNKKRSTPEPKQQPKQVEEKSTPNKKAKTTPTTKSTEPKESTPVKQVKESTPVKQVKATPSKEVKESTPAKQVKESTPVKETKATPAKEVKATPAKEVKATPAKEVKATPAKEVKATPAKEAKAVPTKEAPVKATPVKVAPTKEAPVKATPVKEVPVKATPVKAAPVKEVKSSKEVPVKATPVKKAAAKK